MVSDLQTFTNKVCKIAAQKKLVFGRILPYGAGFFTPFNGLNFPLPEVRCPKFLDFWNLWGKEWKEVVSHLKTFAPKGGKISVLKKVFYIFVSSFIHSVWIVMSKNFRFLESLEKSNGKKWSQIWKLLLIKGVKSQREKRKKIRQLLSYYQDFLVSVLLSTSVEWFSVSRMRDFCLLFCGV